MIYYEEWNEILGEWVKHVCIMEWQDVARDSDDDTYNEAAETTLPVINDGGLPF